MLKLILLLAYLFLLSEVLLAFVKRSRKKRVKIRGDRGSLIALYAVFTLCMTAGFMFAEFRSHGWPYYLIVSTGLFIYLAGLIIRWTSIIQLKNAFTVDVAINKEHDLKTDGLYKIVRHPSYLGLLMVFTGLALSMNGIYSFFIITCPVFLVIMYRIHVEEKVLTEAFGEAYLDYSKKTRKIIPLFY